MIPWHVEDVMTRDVIYVGPEAGYTEIVDALFGRGISAVPVVDGTGKVVGVVSEADLLLRVEGAGIQRPRPTNTRRVPRRKQNAMRAGELMTSPAITIGPDAPIAAAARKLDAARIKRMPVVDADGRLVGIVSRRDLLRMYTRPDDEIHHDIVEAVLRKGLWIDPATVDILVQDGVVTLGGRVETRSLAGFAAKLTASVPGVVQVINELSWVEDDSRRLHEPGYAFGTPEQLLLPDRR